MVAITSACANITPSAAIGLGMIAGIVSAWAVGLKYRWGCGESLDVLGVHLVSGLIGTIALGLIALPVDRCGAGLFYGGGFTQLWAQLVACVMVMGFTAVMTTIIGVAIHKTIGFRVTTEHEIAGIDLMQHAETGYEFGGLGTGGPFVPHPATSGHLKGARTGAEALPAKKGANA
ncbi:hypothetical protein GCM10025778_09240 [Paeniglutamicibacter antarcticus]|uniref:Ammonium transporter AmtB-like domain-containing protein n=1 Tax=Paeniglutamicibacter antarcticus TaxID=494023 RepID=A0ABP9TKV8_9MICC